MITAPHARSMDRTLAALPDAVTALYFLSLWWFPLLLGQYAVRNGMLLVLVEFLMLHASIIIGGTLLSPDIPRLTKVKRLGGFALLYGLFVGIWSFTFQAWWPLLAFGWLLAIKFSVLFGRDMDNAVRLQRLKETWAIAAAAYIVGAVLTTFLWIPALGITASVRTQLELPGGGLWVEQPQKVVVFGLLYFAALALVKWTGWTLPKTHHTH